MAMPITHRAISPTEWKRSRTRAFSRRSVRRATNISRSTQKFAGEIVKTVKSLKRDLLFNYLTSLHQRGCLSRCPYWRNFEIHQVIPVFRPARKKRGVLGFHQLITDFQLGIDPAGDVF